MHSTWQDYAGNMELDWVRNTGLRSLYYAEQIEYFKLQILAKT